MKVLVTQSCPALCDAMDCSLPGSSVHGIFQARILEWVAIWFSKGSSWPRVQTHISHIACIGRQILYCWDTGEALTWSVDRLNSPRVLNLETLWLQEWPQQRGAGGQRHLQQGSASQRGLGRAQWASFHWHEHHCLPQGQACGELRW